MKSNVPFVEYSKKLLDKNEDPERSKHKNHAIHSPQLNKTIVKVDFSFERGFCLQKYNFQWNQSLFISSLFNKTVVESGYISQEICKVAKTVVKT